VHTVSLFYRGDQWSIGGGIRNLLDRRPPMVDDSEVPRAFRNVPFGFGYDVNGRTYFLNVQAHFE
jgi:iron complex outermembrane receptor protein